jgi:hypothetical protein
MYYALPAEENHIWWIALGVGLVVIICVIVLLVLLGAFVSDINGNVGSVRAEVGELERNTSATAAMNETPQLIGEIAAELSRHVAVLSSKSGELG